MGSFREIVTKAVIGKDIGEIIESDNKGVKVTALENAEEMLKQVKPDICIVETMSLLNSLLKYFSTIDLSTNIFKCHLFLMMD